MDRLNWLTALIVLVSRTIVAARGRAARGGPRNG